MTIYHSNINSLLVGLIVGILIGIVLEDSFDIIHFKNKQRKR